MKQSIKILEAHNAWRRGDLSVSENTAVVGQAIDDCIQAAKRYELVRTLNLAPSLEPAFRRVVNGLAFDMGDSRAARLKCVGNGVVPLQAATAVVILARRAGLFGDAR